MRHEAHEFGPNDKAHTESTGGTEVMADGRQARWAVPDASAGRLQAKAEPHAKGAADAKSGTGTSRSGIGAPKWRQKSQQIRPNPTKSNQKILTADAR